MAVITNLVSYWSQDESSGNALDAHGSNTLTDNNTVGSTTGKVSGCRDFERGNSESFSISSNSTLQFDSTTDFTFAAWVQLESKPASDMTFIGKGSASDYEYFVQYQNGSPSLFRFGTFGATAFNAASEITASTFGEPSTATWYFVVAWFDAGAATGNIQVNNGAVDSTFFVGPYAGSDTFYLSAVPFSGYWDGLIDEVGLWNRVLTSGERTWLYNSGAGRSYADIVAEGGGGAKAKVMFGRALRFFTRRY